MSRAIAAQVETPPAKEPNNIAKLKVLPRESAKPRARHACITLCQREMLPQEKHTYRQTTCEAQSTQDDPRVHLVTRPANDHLMDCDHVGQRALRENSWCNAHL